ncbi:MAG: lysylphosphatidylglycerol synthase transmembrane domain-containing protein [Chloroflexota bacterium]
MRKHISTLLKIAISVIGLLLAFRQIQFDELQAELVTIRWSWVILGFILVWLGIVLRAYRWLVLVQGLGLEIPFRRLVRIYFVGAFFNTFLPTGFGGDVVRVVEASNDVPTHIAAGTVIVDRLTGLLMLFVMALFALPFRPPDFPDSLVLFTVGVSLLGLLGGWLFLEGKLIRRLGGWLPGKLSLMDKKQPLAKLLDTVQACGWQAIFRALAVSTVFNFFLVAMWWVFGQSLNLNVSYGYYLLVVPIMSIVLLVPSIGGLGVRESLAPTLFMAAGLVASQAVALALLVSIANRLAGLVGGPMYAFSGARER